MELDLKSKIELHGAAIKKEVLLSNSRFILVILVVSVILRGALNQLVIMLILFYAAFIVMTSLKKIEKFKMYYTFEPAHPSYAALSVFGEPDSILEEINSQAREGKILYNTMENGKAKPETLITEEYFVHLNKLATFIPLKEIICAYIYDRTTKETPDERLQPTRFKPLYLIITYGAEKEAVFSSQSIDCKKVLEVLNERLNCRISYTREMGMLYKTDYEAFLEKVAEAKG